jgi:hypothetical protein
VTSRKQAIAIGLSEARRKVPRSRKKNLRAFKEEQHVWIRNSWDNRDCLLDSLADKKGITTAQSEHYTTHQATYDLSRQPESGCLWSSVRMVERMPSSTEPPARAGSENAFSA